MTGTRARAHFNTERAIVQNGTKSDKKLGRGEVAKLPFLRSSKNRQAKQVMVVVRAMGNECAKPQGSQ